MTIVVRSTIPGRRCSSRSHLACPLRGVYSDTTQLNWPSWTAYSQVSHVFVYDVTTYKLSQLGHTTFIDRWHFFTLWTCRQLDVELSYVAINTPLKATFHYSNQLQTWLQTWFSTRFAAKFSTSSCGFATCFRHAFDFFLSKTWSRTCCINLDTEFARRF